jgi:hypothetical protein
MYFIILIDQGSDESKKYKVVQIWPGQTVTCLHTNSPGHIWTTLYLHNPPLFRELIILE